MDRIKLPPFSNVVSGGLATLSTNALNGMSVHAFVFVTGGTTFTKSNISSLLVDVGGKKLVSNMSADHLQSINSQKGLSDPDDNVNLYMGNPVARTIKGQHLTDLDMSVNAGNVEIQAQIDSSADAPTLDCYALVNGPKVGMGVGYSAADARNVKAYLRSVLTPSNAVTKQAYDIAIGSAAGAAIETIYLFNSKLSSFEVKKQGVVIQEDMSGTLNDAINADYGRVAQSGLYSWQPTADRNIGQAVRTVRNDGRPYSMQFLVTTSASDTITTYAEVATTLFLI